MYEINTLNQLRCLQFSRAMSLQRCDYCLSAEIVNHSEGATCRSCCRLQNVPLYLPSQGCDEKIDNGGNHNLPELEVLVDRHLITREIADSSQKLLHKLRRLNINFATSTLLILVIHQSMAEHIGATFSMMQLSSLTIPDVSQNILIKRYAKLWQKFPKLFKYSPYFPKQYIPLHLLLACCKTRKKVFRKAQALQAKSGYIIQLGTCVLVTIRNIKNICVDGELLDFVCNFPHHKHISYIQSLC